MLATFAEAQNGFKMIISVELQAEIQTNHSIFVVQGVGDGSC